MDLKILFIEDDEKLGLNLKKSFNDISISGYTLKADLITQFEAGISIIQESDFDLVILDLYKDKDVTDEEAGIKILEAIRKSAFMPVVFYTGHAYKITELISEIVGVVSKGDGIKALTMEIEKIINSKIAILKSQIYNHLKESLRKYFWETVDAKKQIFIPGKSNVSFGYLLLRRFANSLSKENIKDLLGDDKIKPQKAHPMEFYIYPTNDGEYEAGEILCHNDVYYTILTPTCDFVKEGERPRKVGKVLLGIASDLKESNEYIKYMESKSNTSLKEITKLIESRKSDRFFFLPGTPFLPNLILDFQNKMMCDYSDLNQFSRVAKLDSPHAQSMVASFIRYYNRVGYPDIDAEYIISNFQ